MPTRTHVKTHGALGAMRRFVPLYSAVLFLFFHWSLTAYINSSYLEAFISNSAIGVLFALSAAISVLVFLFISRVLRRLGNYRFTLTLITIEFLAIMGMGAIHDPRIVLPLFVVHQIVLPLLIFTFDIFMESLIGEEEGSTGSRRGFMLTIGSFIGATAALVAGLLVIEGSAIFDTVYFASAAMLIPVLMLIIRNFKHFKDPPYSELKVLSAIHNFWIHIHIRRVFLANFLLQMFFAWMVIYVPLFFYTEVGLSWPQIGLIFFVAQLAYVIFEYPVGVLADRYIGEKEMMAFGFLVLAVATSWLSFISGAAILPWMIAMFLTRVGASFVEVTTESYFFKQTRGSDSQYISFFRVTRPLAYVVGALFGSVVLLYLPFNLIFVVLAFAMIPGIFLALRIKDTR